MHRILQDILIELSSHTTLDIAFSHVLQPLNPTAVMFVADPPDTRTVSELWTSLGQHAAAEHQLHGHAPA